MAEGRWAMGAASADAKTRKGERERQRTRSDDTSETKRRTDERQRLTATNGALPAKASGADREEKKEKKNCI